MKTTTISPQAELYQKLLKTLGEMHFTGERIRFHFNHEAVGEIDLPAFTTTEARLCLAKMAGVDRFDNWEFIARDGSVRANGNVEINGKHLGSHEGELYNTFFP